MYLYIPSLPTQTPSPLTPRAPKALPINYDSDNYYDGQYYDDDYYGVPPAVVILLVVGGVILAIGAIWLCVRNPPHSTKQPVLSPGDTRLEMARNPQESQHRVGENDIYVLYAGYYEPRPPPQVATRGTRGPRPPAYDTSGRPGDRRNTADTSDNVDRIQNQRPREPENDGNRDTGRSLTVLSRWT